MTEKQGLTLRFNVRILAVSTVLTTLNVMCFCPLCLSWKTPLLHTAIMQSEELRSGFCPSNHHTKDDVNWRHIQQIKERRHWRSNHRTLCPWGQPMMIYQRRHTRGVEFSRQMSLKNLNSAIRSWSRTDKLKPFPI